MRVANVARGVLRFSIVAAAAGMFSFEVKEAGHFPNCDDAALGDFVGHCMNLTAKLAGALGSVARGWEPDEGMTIARLKRILTILNEGLTASDRVPAKYLSPDRLLHFRSGLFALREDILALIARLRGGG